MSCGSEAGRAERLPRGCFKTFPQQGCRITGDVSCWVCGLALRRDWDEGVQGRFSRMRRTILRTEKSCNHGPAPRAPHTSGSPRGRRWTDVRLSPGHVPGACRRLSVVPVACGAALADTRQPEPAYLATLFDQPLARAVPPPERWVDHTAAGSAAVLPMLSFQVTECWTDPEAWVASQRA